MAPVPAPPCTAPTRAATRQGLDRIELALIAVFFAGIYTN